MILPEAPLWMLVIYLPVLATAVAIGLGRSISAKSVFGALLPTFFIMMLMLLLSSSWALIALGSLPQVGLALNATNPFTHLIALIDPWSIAEGFAEHPTESRVSLGLASICVALLFVAFVYGRMSLSISGFDHAIRTRSGERTG